MELVSLVSAVLKFHTVPVVTAVVLLVTTSYFCLVLKKAKPSLQQDINTSSSVRIGKKVASVTAEESTWIEDVLSARAFKDWVESVGKEERMAVSKVHIQSVDMFGKRVGFIKFKADVTVDGKPIPGIVFMRGSAVTILVVFNCGGRQLALVVRQPRVPVGLRDVAEIPAGFLDGDGNFAGEIAKAIEENIGLKINQSKLEDMTNQAYQDKFPGIFPSCGGSDEFNRVLLLQKSISQLELDGLYGRLNGAAAQGDSTKLEIVPLESLWKISPDSKTLTALTLYQKLDLAPAQSPMKHVFFDFDQTITRIHVFHALAAQGARSETGQVHLMQDLDATGKTWQFNMDRKDLVLHPEGDLWSIATLGGPARVQLLRELLGNLQHAGVKLTVITKGNVGVIKYILAQVDLLFLFEAVYGNVGNMYGQSDYDKAHSHPTGYESQAEDELKTTKAVHIQTLMMGSGIGADEAVLIEDDINEVNSVDGICKSVYVSERMGMSPYHMNSILELAALPRLRVPSN